MMNSVQDRVALGKKLFTDLEVDEINACLAAAKEQRQRAYTIGFIFGCLLTAGACCLYVFLVLP